MKNIQGNVEKLDKRKGNIKKQERIVRILRSLANDKVLCKSPSTKESVVENYIPTQICYYINRIIFTIYYHVLPKIFIFKNLL